MSKYYSSLNIDLPKFPIKGNKIERLDKTSLSLSSFYADKSVFR